MRSFKEHILLKMKMKDCENAKENESGKGIAGRVLNVSSSALLSLLN